jgi:hypothetical protein
MTPRSGSAKAVTVALGTSVPNPKALLKDQFHEVARLQHLSLRTEENYWE